MKYDGAKDFLKSIEDVVGKKKFQNFLSISDANLFEILLRDKSKLRLRIDNNRLIASRICSISNSINFEFTFKIDKIKETVGLWPLILKQKNQPEINCVTFLKNKELINVNRQSELIKIANMWGKNLRAQKVASFLEQSSIESI